MKYLRCRPLSAFPSDTSVPWVRINNNAISARMQSATARSSLQENLSATSGERLAIYQKSKTVAASERAPLIGNEVPNTDRTTPLASAEPSSRAAIREILR